MSKEGSPGRGDVGQRRSCSTRKTPEREGGPIERQLGLGLSIAGNQERANPVGHGDAHAHAQSTREHELLEVSRPKHVNAIEASRSELIAELSVYLRTNLNSLHDPDVREFTEEEESEFFAWVEDLSDDQLVEEIELRGEKLIEKIKRLTEGVPQPVKFPRTGFVFGPPRLIHACPDTVPGITPQ